MRPDKLRCPDLHHHSLYLEYKKNSYNCDGCKERGYGERYKCKRCEFDLHVECKGAATDCSTDAPIFYEGKKKFKFYKSLPVKSKRQRTECTAYGYNIRGFVFQSKCGQNLHPCCLKLEKIENKKSKFDLSTIASSKCCLCGRNEIWEGFTGWWYNSDCSKYHIHVHCLKKRTNEAWMTKFLYQGSDIPDHELKNLIFSGNSNISGRRMKMILKVFRFLVVNILDPKKLMFTLI